MTIMRPINSLFSLCRFTFAYILVLLISLILSASPVRGEDAARKLHESGTPLMEHPFGKKLEAYAKSVKSFIVNWADHEQFIKIGDNNNFKNRKPMNYTLTGLKGKYFFEGGVIHANTGEPFRMIFAYNGSINYLHNSKILDYHRDTAGQGDIMHSYGKFYEKKTINVITPIMLLEPLANDGEFETVANRAKIYKIFKEGKEMNVVSVITNDNGAIFHNMYYYQLDALQAQPVLSAMVSLYKSRQYMRAEYTYNSKNKKDEPFANLVSWKTTLVDQSNVLVAQSYADNIKFQINPSVNEQIFDYKFPPGLKVSDSRYPNQSFIANREGIIDVLESQASSIWVYVAIVIAIILAVAGLAKMRNFSKS